MRHTSRKPLNAKKTKSRRTSKVSRIDSKFTTRLLALHEHARRLASTTDLDEIVTNTMDAIEFALGFDFATFSIVDPVRQTLRRVALRGMKPSFSELPLGGPGVTVASAKLRKTIRIPDTRKEPAYVDDGGRTEKEAERTYLSELSVPVIVDSKTAAVLNVESGRLDAFSETDQRLLETLASHVASAFGRLQSELLLRRSEERFRGYAERAADGIVEIDIEGHITYVSPASEKVLGYKPGELLGTHFASYLSESSISKIAPTIAALMEGREVLRVEGEILRKDGTPVPVEMNTQPIFRDGKVVGAQGIVRDVTERKTMEEILRASERKYRQLFQNLPHGIYQTSPDGKLLTVNPALVRMLGYESESELLAVDVAGDLYLNPEERRAWTQRLEKDGEVRDAELVLRRKNGRELTVLDNAHAVLDELGRATYYEGTLTDITERKQMEDKLFESEEKYRALVESSPNVILVLQEGVLRYVNQATCERLGWTFEEMTSPSFSAVEKMIPERFRPTVYERISKRLGGEHVPPYEVNLVTRDGLEFPVSIRGEKIMYLGKPANEVIMIDISDRKLMEESLRRRAEELVLLQETLLDISGRRELSQLLNRMVERAAELLDAPGGGLYLCDPDKREARCVVAYNTKVNAVGFVLKYGEGAAGVVAQTGKPLIIDDYRVWSGRAAAYEKDKPFGAVLSAPMIWQGQVIGVIHVLRYDTKPFTKENLALLTLFANHAAVAVENARLYEQLDQHAAQLERMVKERTGKLAESEARYRRLFESSPISLWEEDFSTVKKFFDELRERGIKDLRGYLVQHPEDVAKCASMVKVVNVNEATLGLYGAETVEELLGELSRVLTHESQAEIRFTEELVALGEGRTRFESEFDNQTLRGDIRHVSLILNVVPGYEKTLAKVLVSIIDLTQRKEMEQQLRQSEERFRGIAAKLAETQNQLQVIADSLPAVIGYVDSEQRYRFNNKTYEEWFGQSRNAIFGRHIRETLGEQGYERVRRHMDAALSGVPQTFEYELDLRSGTRQISATYIPDLAEDGEVKGVFVLGIDVTERKRIEERLLKAERLAAVGETAAMVGHDLRNPLQAISAATYLLEKNLSSAASEQTKEMLEAIENSIHYSDRIVSDLLEYSQELRLEFSETTPKSLASAAISQVKIPRNITVLDSTSDDPKIRVDAVRVKRVFVNLVENAVDAMPNGGELRITSNMSNGRVEVKFTDTGQGIDEDVLRQLWKPLVTTKPKGIGLGLAICKHIAEAHGGSISVESRAGQGTTFTLTIPIAPSQTGDKGR